MIRSIERPAVMLVVELQNDLCSPTLTSSEGLSGALARAVADAGILERLPGVLDACRSAGIPVLYATKERHPSLPLPTFPPIYKLAGIEPKLVHGTWGAQVVDAVKPEPGDIMLPRFTSIDPSYGSELWSVCERLGARTMIVAGISTTMAVEGTVRAAANRGFRVIVPHDCCTSVPYEKHRISAFEIMTLLADITTADELISALR